MVALRSDDGEHHAYPHPQHIMADDFAAAEARFRSYVDRNKTWSQSHPPSADWAHYPAHAACAVGKSDPPAATNASSNHSL